jgi:hypothetical protein
MAQSSIVLQVILPSTGRTDEILAATADRLALSASHPTTTVAPSCGCN